MYYGGLMGYYFDPTWILVIIGAVLSMAASAKVNSTFNKSSKVRSITGMTGEDAAKRLLNSQGIYDVTVRPVKGQLTDHYDPRTKTVNLSESVFHSTSVAAIGGAAHECGHAMQHAEGYVPIKIRSAIIPVTQVGSRLWYLIFVLGLIFSSSEIGPVLQMVGILLFSLIVVFQLVTLPVEFNASGRAMKTLETHMILYGDDLTKARKVLTAAAMTYVAALLNGLLQLIRLISVSKRSNR